METRDREIHRKVWVTETQRDRMRQREIDTTGKGKRKGWGSREETKQGY